LSISYLYDFPPEPGIRYNCLHTFIIWRILKARPAPALITQTDKSATNMSIAGSVTNLMGYYIFYGLTRPLLYLPLPVLFVFSELLYLLACYFPGYRKNMVMMNLHNAFPDKSDREIKKIARGFYRHMCDSIIESFAILTMSRKELEKRVIWKNPGLLDQYYEQGRSVISVFGHYGNWELLCSLPLHTRHRVLALYKPLTNIYFDRFMKKLRQKFGVQAVAATRSYSEILRYHREQVPTISLFLGDQRPARENIRYWTKFLNQDTPVMFGSEHIARKLDHVVVFLAMSKVKRGFYEIEIIPVTEIPGSTGMYEITEMHTRLLEEQIQKRPEYWLWSHNRWKHVKELQA
jgi:Kdo2-lipid IVA lauroyltransferase/acyltransferase